jgi:hypothetical protein
MDANSLFQFFPDATTSGKERMVLGTKKKKKIKTLHSCKYRTQKK